jgi:hypothetical protein
MLEENNPRDFMDVFLQQMEAEYADENSTFTGSCIIPNTGVHTLWHNCFTPWKLEATHLDKKFLVFMELTS